MRSHFLTARAAVRRMVRRGSGVILAFGRDGPQTLPGLGGFKVALDAIEGLRRQWACELGQRRFPLCNPGPLASLFAGAGLTRVAVQPIDIWTVFMDFDDYWSPFLGGQGPAPGYVISLSEAGRTALLERLRGALPFAPDGSLPLMARAWAVRGVLPAVAARVSRD
jgi:hypothetical protein